MNSLSDWYSSIDGDRLLLIAHAATTLAMVGVIWTIQLVVYPQFRSVDPDNFSSYLADHSVRVTAVLALFAPLEVILALSLWLRTPYGVSAQLTFAAGLLLVVLWVSTGLYYGPYHGRLQQEGYDLANIDQLINTNWLRTILWSVRGGVALWFLTAIEPLTKS